MQLTFGDRILLLRKKSKIQQQQLADKLGITTAQLAEWEGDADYPPFDQAVKLADALNISLDFLAGRIKQQIEPANLQRMEDAQNMEQKAQATLYFTIDALIRVDKGTKIYGENDNNI